jgi:3-phosphoglycerate kinase
MTSFTCINDISIENKRALLRADFNISLNESSHAIANDERIRGALPTIKALLKGNNTIVICSHLGQPKGYDDLLGLDNVAIRLQRYLPETDVTFYDYDPLKDAAANLADWKRAIQSLPLGSVAVIDNLRYFPGEKLNDPQFAKALSEFTDIYVSDAFGVAHCIFIHTLLSTFCSLPNCL